MPDLRDRSREQSLPIFILWTTDIKSQQSGFIGRSVVPELINNGHEVLGLARSDASAENITKSGGSVLRGELNDLEALKKGASTTDGVIHLAFIHAFESPEAFQAATAADRAAITAMAEAMAGTNKPLIICSGTLGYPAGQISDEDTEPKAVPGFDRDLTTQMIYSLSKEKGIRGMVMRLAPVVHGHGDGGFVNLLGGAGKKNGFVPYVADGSARWTAVHVKDAAVAFRLAVEKGRGGVTYLPIAEGQVRTKDLMETIAKKVGVKAESKTVEEMAGAIGFLAHLMSMDTPVTSEKTKKELGWEPKEIGLLEDVEKNYFN